LPFFTPKGKKEYSSCNRGSSPRQAGKTSLVWPKMGTPLSPQRGKLLLFRSSPGKRRSPSERATLLFPHRRLMRPSLRTWRRLCASPRPPPKKERRSATYDLGKVSFSCAAENSAKRKIPNSRALLSSQKKRETEHTTYPLSPNLLFGGGDFKRSVPHQRKNSFLSAHGKEISTD